MAHQQLVNFLLRKISFPRLTSLCLGHLLRLKTLAASNLRVNNYFCRPLNLFLLLPSALASGGLELKGKPR